ncbi:hypothetical protein KDW_47840 [Dictyobacter vulcani]|uniref:Secreted protein n=1 Tax=Dictyobacter vulcani TaxID=2607529 RepID=A0A5J4KTW4_9CHLR|nr:hypothetical protein [Dictyobacter vulcani]GER90622.1 hypothetical protein KDW_47840 [Dictyobacter vulcani]
MYTRCLATAAVVATLLMILASFCVPTSQAAGLHHVTASHAGNGPYGPDTCLTGYVWREAFTDDHVCVTPDQRTRAAFDNSQARYRVNPHGAYGSDSCRSGYVWREAGPNDHVCVTPEQRTQTAYDNEQALSRYAA